MKTIEQLKQQVSEDDYEQMLNDNYEHIDIFDLLYDVGTTLRKIDPVRFQTFYDSFINDLLDDENR